MLIGHAVQMRSNRVHPGGLFRLACLKGADVSKNQKDPPAGLRCWPQPSPNHLPEHCLTSAQKAEIIPSPALSHKEKKKKKTESGQQEMHVPEILCFSIHIVNDNKVR